MKLDWGLQFTRFSRPLAYKDNCPLRPVKTGRQSLKWAVELESLRREVRRTLICADQIRNHIDGHSIEWLSAIIGRR